MRSKDQLTPILNSVYKTVTEILSEKVSSVILYGSYARGDFDDESDIDIMVLANVPAEKCHRYSMDIGKMLCKIELENDVVISVNVVSLDVFEKYKGVLPYYKNVEREGIKIAV